MFIMRFEEYCFFPLFKRNKNKNLLTFGHAMGLLSLHTYSSPSWDQGRMVEEAKSNKK